MVHEKVRTFGGFTEDEKTPEDAVIALKKTFGDDIAAWSDLVESGKLSGEILALARIELADLKQKSGPV